MRNIQAFISLFILTFAALMQPLNAQAATGATNSQSIEFMCKSKAKEIAAETYSGCINDNKQAELERIRKEYQTELAKMKSKYNNELKGLTQKKSKPAERVSANRGNERSAVGEMPAKKMKTTRVRTEKIDFSSGDSSSDSQSEDVPAIQSDLGSDSNLTSSEIVEIPVQEE